MKKRIKFALTGGLLLLTAAVASGCTSNFCTNEEKSRILFAIEPGVSCYYSSNEEAVKSLQHITSTYTVEQVFENNDHLYRLVEVDTDGKYVKSNQLSTIISQAKAKYYSVPSTDYFIAFDNHLLSMAITEYNKNVIDKYSEDTITAEQVNQVLTQYGYLKFYGSGENHNGTIWENYQTLNGVIASEIGIEKCPTLDFSKLYQTQLNTSVANTKSCIAIETNDYGAYGQDKISVEISRKDWGYAWSKGPISGLIVFPVSFLVDSITAGIAGGTGRNVLNAGWPQLVALVIVTIIVRLFIFLATFKSTLSQQKMQALQPELAKIQAKYPNSNTSRVEKQRLAEEQMRLYKKNKVNPMGQLLVLFIQFPIFIGVWGAMTGSAVLSTGAFLNLNLSTSIWDALRNTTGLPGNANGWWTALILFILMAASQFFAMKVPQWINKARTKKVARFGVNPAQTQQNKTMNIVSYVMLIMIIIMGFTLPAAMGVYWFVGAIFSLAQSLITQGIVGKKKDKNRR